VTRLIRLLQRRHPIRLIYRVPRAIRGDVPLAHRVRARGVISDAAVGARRRRPVAARPRRAVRARAVIDELSRRARLRGRGRYQCRRRQREERRERQRAPHARETRPRLFRHFATRRRFRLYASPTIDDMRPSRVCAPATHVSLAGVADARVGAVRAM
tara:strand:+ start:6585 stop:7058 length:474 start_codon:yes stop_codon:yes gene_type:complete